VTEVRPVWWTSQECRQYLDDALAAVFEARADDQAEPGHQQRVAERLLAALHCLVQGYRSAGQVRGDDVAILHEVLANLAPREHRSLTARANLAQLSQLAVAEPDEARPELVAEVLDAILGRPSRRLACYGTLRPGEMHDDVLLPLHGTWTDGEVTGIVTAWQGYPRLQWSDSAPPVPVSVLESDELPAAWRRIDLFEGDGYIRSVVPVSVEGDTRVASCYLAKP
jgi:gamma-glutamylcyclotransferase (GGCT)/AIG2-like uncharacterized protein YtfP